MGWLVIYIPKLGIPGAVVQRELDIEDGHPAAVFVRDDGLELRLRPNEDRVRFEANRDGHVDPKTGVLVFVDLERRCAHGSGQMLSTDTGSGAEGDAERAIPPTRAAVGPAVASR
jgi:hypothetical protein